MSKNKANYNTCHPVYKTLRLPLSCASQCVHFRPCLQGRFLLWAKEAIAQGAIFERARRAREEEEEKKSIKLFL